MRQTIIFLWLVCLTMSAQAQNPVMLDDVLMDQFNLAPDNGMLQLDKLRAMHLPASCANKNSLTVTFKKGSQKLASATGMPLPPKRNVSWLMNYFRPDDDASRSYRFTEPGDYLLEFSVEGRVFDTFPFSVAQQPRKNGKTMFVANGPWDELGFVTHKPRVPFKFSYYMRDFLEGTGERKWDYGKYSARLIRKNDNQVVGVSNPKGDNTHPPLKYWKRFDLMFVDNATDRNQLQCEQVLAKDGDYEVEFTFEGQLHGRYPFKVAGGKFVGLAQHEGLPLGTDGTVFWCPRQK